MPAGAFVVVGRATRVRVHLRSGPAATMGRGRRPVRGSPEPPA